MTLQESIQMQDRLAKSCDLIISTMNSSAKISKLFLDSANRIVQSFSSAYTSFPDFTSVVDSLLQTQQNMLNWYTKIDYAGIKAALNAVEQIQNSLIDSASLLDNLPYQALLNSLSSTLEQVEPYLPPEEKEQCETIIKPQLKEKAHTRLTLGDALSILSILLSIRLFVIGSMPDDQTERIIQQQEAIIANQEAEIAQLRKEDQALLDTLDSLSDSINLLTNEIELLRDEIKDADNPPDNPGQANPGEPQQDSSDTQD